MKGDFNVGKIMVLLAISFSWFSCESENAIITNPLIGKWVSPYNQDTYWEFTSDKNVNYLRDGREWPGNVEIMVSRGGIEYKSTTFGPLHYKYQKSKDTIKFETFGSLNNLNWMKYAALRDDNILYIWNYKTLPGIENHIDEVSYFCLEGKTCPSQTSRKITVVIETGLAGAVHIAFNQRDGIPPEFDQNDNPVIRINQGTIHKTQLPWHPAYMTHNAFDFVVKDCETGALTDINDWGHDAYRKKAINMLKSDTVTFKTSDYSLSAFSYGFNQYGRTDLDYEFGEYLSGQVASFGIDYLTDRYEYKEYMKKVKAKGEDVKG